MSLNSYFSELSEVMWHMVLMQGIHSMDTIENKDVAFYLQPIVASIVSY